MLVVSPLPENSIGHSHRITREFLRYGIGTSIEECVVAACDARNTQSEPFEHAVPSDRIDHVG